jgi:hypothetical protein
MTIRVRAADSGIVGLNPSQTAIVALSCYSASAGMRCTHILGTWGAIHQLLSIIHKLRILVLLPVSNLPYVCNLCIFNLSVFQNN